MPQYATHNHGYNMSFDASQQQAQALGQPAPAPFSQSFSGPISTPGFARSFGDGKKGAMRGFPDNPQIYTVCHHLLSETKPIY